MNVMESIRQVDELRESDAWRRMLDVLAGRRIVVLAGAGCSTESGIPDYRGTGAPRRRAPVQYQEFVRSSSARARYWARSSIGWPRMRAAQPNPAHSALARMEKAGHVTGLITQNVDGLHHRAGSRRVVELHGSLASVRCMDCGAISDRDTFQHAILELNPGWPPLVNANSAPRAAAHDAALARTAPTHGSASTPVIAAAPDGDADLPDDMLERFRAPACASCAGIMKPHVVFFGENVPASVVAEAWRVYEEGDVLLVTGSSLAVYSGRRFIYRACRDGVPIVIVNRGPTRADDVAAAKIDGALGVVLPPLARALVPSDQGSDSHAGPIGHVVR